jgi:putative transposase
VAEKKLICSIEARRTMLEPNHTILSLARQCTLLGLPRSTAYYRSCRDDVLDLELMRLMDEQYLKTPFYGVRRFTDWLRDLGHAVGFKRVQRLMRTLGIEAIYPNPG